MNISNKTIAIMVGLPGSGKSTFAATLGGNIVCPDSIREEICGSVEDQSKNGYIFSVVVPQRIRESVLKNALTIYDATSLKRSYRNSVVKIAKEVSPDIQIIFYVMGATLQQCLDRNSNRQRKVPEKIIMNMFDGYAPVEQEEGEIRIVPF